MIRLVHQVPLPKSDHPSGYTMESFLRGPGDVFHVTTEPDNSLAPLVNLSRPDFLPGELFAAFKNGTLFAIDEFSYIHRYSPDTAVWKMDREKPWGVNTELCVNPAGYLLATGEEPITLDIISPDGERHITPLRDPGYFEVPPGGRRPFWETGARSVSATLSSFIIGGGPMARIDHYALSGKWLGSFERVRIGDKEVLCDGQYLSSITFGPRDEVWAFTEEHIVQLALDGRLLGAWHVPEFNQPEVVPDLDWFMVDHLGRIWAIAGQIGNYRWAHQVPKYMICLVVA